MDDNNLSRRAAQQLLYGDDVDDDAEVMDVIDDSFLDLVEEDVSFLSLPDAPSAPAPPSKRLCTVATSDQSRTPSTSTSEQYWKFGVEEPADAMGQLHSPSELSIKEDNSETIPEAPSKRCLQKLSAVDLTGIDVPSEQLPIALEQLPVPQDEIAKEFGPDYFVNDCESDDDNTCLQSEAVPLDVYAELVADSDSDAGSESEEQERPSGQEDPIYDGANINMWESLAAILSFVQSEHISGVGLGRLLSLVDLHLPQPNNFKKTNHSLFKLLENVKETVEIHHFCSICYKTRKCMSDLCDTCTDPSRSVHYFITFPLAPQVQKLFKRPDFVRNLMYKQTRTKQNENNIEDIYDGEMYKNRRFSINGITLMWNTDGIAVFKSNSYSLWPFYLVINELSPDHRFRTENLIIAGIWGSVVKPHPNVYLLPIFKELSILKNGIDVQVYGEEEIQKLEATVVCGSCDAPATAGFLNMKTHSGFYSCPKCLVKGVKPGDATVFPYKENVPLRDMESYKEHVKIAVEKRVILTKTVRQDELFCGIKGPTILSDIVDDLFSSMAIDSMHCLYLGVMRQMLKTWFEGKYQAKAKLVSQKLLELTPPHFLQRVPLPIEKLIYWKATQLRSFLFNLCMVLLRDILDKEHYNHFSLFVKGVSLLNSSSISEEDLQVAENCLNQFVREFEGFYGVDNMSHNIHMCLHLHQSVRSLGPLWSVSCFKFEDINGRILNLVHGTRNIGFQIHSNLGVISHLPVMIDNLKEGPVKRYCTNIKRRYRLKLSELISSGIYCVGRLYAVGIDKAWVLGLLRKSITMNSASKVNVFHRLLKNGLLFVSSSYKKSDRISSYVKYKKDDIVKYGNVVCFVKVDNNSLPPNYLAVLKPVPVVPFKTDVVVFNHLFKCDTSGLVESFFNCDLIDINDMLRIMFKIEDSGLMFLSEPLNDYELE